MRSTTTGFITGFLFLIALINGPKAFAHCDTMNGPVVKDARIALQKSDVTPVLKWIKPEYEEQIKAAFKQTLTVRAQSKAAQELADIYFFETLVRLHRAGEGMPYTGLKPASTEIEPGIAAADDALDHNTVEPLVASMTKDIGKETQQRFARVTEAKRHSEESIEAGREYVEAYVSFIHYVERLHQAAATSPESEGHSHID